LGLGGRVLAVGCTAEIRGSISDLCLLISAFLIPDAHETHHKRKQYEIRSHECEIGSYECDPGSYECETRSHEYETGSHEREVGTREREERTVHAEPRRARGFFLRPSPISLI